MGIKRIGKHLLEHRWRVRRVFPPRVLATSSRRSRRARPRHSGQVRFVVEGALDGAPLFRNQPARERALDVFAHLRIWDTAHNNGVLIYLLLADRDVEIVADRGIDAMVGAAGWEEICRDDGSAFQERAFRGRCDQGGSRRCRASWRSYFPRAMLSPRNELAEIAPEPIRDLRR